MTAETTVSGVAAKRVVIADACREMHGDMGAFHKAAFELLKEYDAITQRRGDEKGINYHLVLTVENPTQVKDSSDRARRPTERLTRMPEAERALPVTPASSLAPPDDPKPSADTLRGPPEDTSG